ncbi:sterol desaturase family protein [Qipengyuania sp. 1NDW9]|uniref:sterol desaturase family protein n=1 Tax=Qipengyuania xiapuensis TaxID=2867236 RepID=UPI001C86E784|nr:sterol desaturase family protein [Qipengyuania xiapuensis]MBX7492976.1 sterol desaturase family protein [Qipengyuania xiapuensis]
MEIFAPYARATLTLLASTGLVFGLLALVVKRNRIVEAVKLSRREFMTNLGLALINAIILAPLFVFPGNAISGALGVNETLAGLWDGVWKPVTLLLAILLLDLVVYWRHRLEHHPLLWPIHATHHADTTLQWMSTLRKHPLSKLLSVCVDMLLVLYLGVPAWAVGAALLLRSWWAFFIHCDVPWTLGIFGNVLISPAAHRLHHIRDEALMGSNYGNTVTLWDKVFGTYVDPAPYLDCETGIAEGTRGVAGELMRPFEKRYWKKTSDETEAPA